MTNWTPKLFWFLDDPPDDDPSIPTWAWCIQDTETYGDGTDPAGAVAFIREALPQWAAVTPELPRELRIIVSGTGPDVALVEVEDVNGRSVSPDTMRDRPDGTRELVFFGVGGGP